MTEIFGDILLRMTIDADFVDAWTAAFVSDKKIIADNLKETLGSEHFA